MLKSIRKIFAPSGDTSLQEVLQKDVFLVDVRTPMEYAAGSIPGAINIPLDQIHHQVSRFEGKKAIVVFCRSGVRSSQAKNILARHHIENVIDGGSRENVIRNLTYQTTRL